MMPVSTNVPTTVYGYNGEICKGGCGKVVCNRIGLCLKCSQRTCACGRSFRVRADSTSQCNQCTKEFRRRSRRYNA
jgi:hypothetical protein